MTTDQPALAAALARFCTDSVEARAFACSGGTARRTGDTLFIRLDSGRDSMFVETGGEAPGGFHYNGRIGRAAFHLIESYGHEAPPVYLLISARTGRHIMALARPIVAPDGARFATGTPDWDNCSESNGSSLDVWRLSDTLPVLDWRVVTQDCKTPPAWGAMNLRWRGSDTLEFVRQEFAPRDAAAATAAVVFRTQPMLAVRESAGWRIVTRAAIDTTVSGRGRPHP